MVCRHARGDRSCTTQYPEYHVDTSPAHEFKEIEQVGPNLVARVSTRSKGDALVVWPNSTYKDAIMWKTVNIELPKWECSPGLRDPDKSPAPLVRFPCTDDGWSDAMEYAARKRVPKE